MSYLGIDLGTSGLRALLVDDAGRVLGSAERAYPVAHPHPGWSEQDPAAWILALDEVMAELAARVPGFASLRGIGVAGHMHGACLLDGDGAVLRPCILWNDTRAHAEAAALDSAPQVRDLSGNIVFPGFTAPKLVWVRAHEPGIFARTARVLLPAAFLNHHLTGEAVADMSDSAGTSWLDVGARDWSGMLLDASGMDRAQMPRLVEGSESAGLLRKSLLEKWGLTGPVTVAGGAGDNAAAACGIGALRDGEGFVSLGTSGVLLAARDGYAPAPETALHTFCHAVPGRWYQMGVMLSATDSLNWLSGITGRKPADLAALAGTVPGPGRVRFLPYLSGERTPHNDAAVRGSFTGLGHDTGVAELARAVLEGVAYGLRDTAEALKGTGADLQSLFAIGGGAASRDWVSIIATVLNLPLKLPEGREFGAALGAARLAICAATEATAEEVMTAPATAEVVEPLRDLVAAYDDGYAAFRAAYPAIRGVQ
ncbi:xylulokinase [Primorskyibacter flagellatus]|uniref:Xylulose kinase n=1 Tax=Primorskyibacter flagellatus TaxID=1387277 RepID=A0A916ZY64_9RHOB|nr:xylulokinase [Primorskyibacter flagellatus]GGE18915.1 xylulokinase [Primorskyibacter flagellatus]